MTRSRLFLVVPFLVAALFSNVARAQHVACTETCSGGSQTPGTGGAPIQAEASVTNQRGLSGSSTTAAQTVGRSTNIIGSQSYTYPVPLFSIPGRGLNLNLTLYYNSLVWQFNSDDNAMRYGGDFDTPAPGFRLGYGFVDFSALQGIHHTGVGLLTEPTGAKHLLVQNGFPKYHTTDSSYIQVQYPAVAGDPAIATFKDGTRVFYQSFTLLANSHTLYRPYQVEDTNGNIISITYTNSNDLNIGTITDTVGRVIQFTYGANGKLQSLGQLDGNGQAFRQYTFNWETRPLTFSFTRLVTSGPGPIQSTLITSGQSQVNLLSKVTRPDGTSVVFDYGFGAGGNPDWGIAKTITEFSSGSTPAARYSTTYIFPAAGPGGGAGGGLVTNPTYSQQIVNDGVNTKTWSYQANTSSGGLVASFVTTDPCGNTMTTTFSAAGDSIDGLPTQSQMANTQPAPSGCPTTPAQTWRTMINNWTTDADGSNPRPQTVTTILENGTTQSQVKFNSYDTFGQVTDLLQYDFGANAPGPLLREMVTTFAALENGIVNRPSQIRIKDGAGSTVARTDFNYDEYSATGITDISPNPAGHDPVFTSSNTVRGNLTSTISYANAAAGGGGITSSFTYDAAGNQLTSQSGCCTFSRQNFSATTQYAFPDSILSGPSGNPLSLTSSATYNMLTGTVATTTDANNQVTRYDYDIDNRLITTTLPDNSKIFQSYDDVSASRSTTMSNSLNSLVETTTTSGPTVTQSVKNGTALVSTTTVTSDLLGRQISASNPFGPNDTATYTSYSYDPLGRKTSVTPPALAGSTQNSYQLQYTPTTFIDAGGSTHSVVSTQSTDPAGKSRREYKDAIGRLVRVDEPGGESAGQQASGSLTISGTLQAKVATSATPGTGSIIISGSEQSKPAIPAAAATASVTITGFEWSATVPGDPYCGQFSVDQIGCDQWVYPTTTVYDSGTVTMVANGHADSIWYGQGSTAASIAVALANAINGDSAAFVNATATNGVLQLTARQTGTAGNSYSWNVSASSTDPADFGSAGSFGGSAASGAMSGGVNGSSLVYDAGTCTATINTTPYSTSFGQGDTTSAIASRLAGVVSGGSLVSATASGATISLTAKTSGASTNYSLSSSCSYDSSHFTSPSFSAGASASSLTGGANGSPAATDAGTVQISVGGYTATANYGNGTGQDGNATAIASDLVTKIQAQLPTNPPFTISAGGATISVNWSSAGAAGNVTVSTASTTTQSGSFPKPSFASCPITINPQNCSTTLSGGTDPVTGTLSTPYITAYTYNARGDLQTVAQGQQTRTYAYDDLGRVTSSCIPETVNQCTTYTYTDFGAVKTQTDPRNITTTYGFDVLNRVNDIQYSDGTEVTYAYGATGAANNVAGRLVSSTDGTGGKSYQYDIMGRMTQVAQLLGGNSYTTKYSYPNGQLGSITYPSASAGSGTQANYNYDAMGRLSSVKVGATTVYSIGSYNAAGQPLTTSFGNGMAGSYGYNNQLRLGSIHYGSATPLMDLTYNYGGAVNNGQIRSITDNLDSTRSTSYIYDALGRLQQAQTLDQTSASSWNLQFSYDRYGNRLSETPAGGRASMPSSQVLIDAVTNHITSAGFSYDPAGNMTRDSAFNYSFDAANHLTLLTPPGVGAPTVAFGYDASGMRVNKGGNFYIFSGGKVIAEYANGAAAASPSAEYIYAGDQRVATIASGATMYHYWDHLSIRSTADASGNVVRTYGSFPFGETWYETGAASKWKFTTYEYDSESGLNYANARFYSPRLGAFMSRDVADSDSTVPQTLNRYPYVTNDPINLNDPSGLFAIGFVSNFEGACGDALFYATNSFACPDLEIFMGGGPFGFAGMGILPGDQPNLSGFPTALELWLASLPWNNPCIMGPISDGCGSGNGFVAQKSDPCKQAYIDAKDDLDGKGKEAWKKTKENGKEAWTEAKWLGTFALATCVVGASLTEGPGCAAAVPVLEHGAAMIAFKATVTELYIMGHLAVIKMKTMDRLSQVCPSSNSW